MPRKAFGIASILLRGLAVLSLQLGMSIPAAHADDIEYVYDELGRVVQATNQTTGQAVIYTYDAVGNITSQISAPVSELSISKFSPRQGVIGASVTITGTGFSATAANNIVRINGTTANVVTASPRKLVALVPTGATTGALSVQVGAATATGGTFTVTSSEDQPTITDVLPPLATVGTSITILGAHFDSSSTKNRVSFNSAQAPVSASTTTSLSVRVPANASSGKIRVTTPRGVAVSAADFIVIPTGVAPAKVSSTGRMPADDTASSINFSASGKVALRVFDGVVGDLFTIGAASTSLADCTISVFAPDGKQLKSGKVNSVAQGLQLPKLRISGAYTIVVDPNNATGNIALKLLRPLQQALTIDGTSASITVAPTGQRAIASFNGTREAYAKVLLTGVTVPSGVVSILAPDGTVLASPAFTASGITIPVQLPVTGAYRIVIEPGETVGGALTIAVTGAGAPSLSTTSGKVDLNLTNQTPVPLTFKGEAGQYLALNGSGTANAFWTASLTVLDPNGKQLISGSLSAATSNNAGNSVVLNMGPLQMGGIYTVMVQAGIAAPGTASVLLSTPVVSTQSADGVTQNMALSTAGRGFLYNVTGRTGQFMALRVSEAGSRISNGVITVRDPDGQVIGSKAFAASGSPSTGPMRGSTILNIGPLTSGAHTILFQQTGTVENTGSLNVTLSTPIQGATEANSGDENVPIDIPGQGVLYTVTGSAGDLIAVHIPLFINAGATSNGASNLTLLDGQGEPLQTSSILFPGGGNDGGVTHNFGPLPTDGIYSLLWQQMGDVGGGDTGLLKFVVTKPQTGVLVTNDPTLHLQIDLSGQGLQYTFAGTAGEYKTIAIRVFPFVDNSGSAPVVHGSWITVATLSVLNPDGSTLATGQLLADGTEVIFQLPAPVPGLPPPPPLPIGFIAQTMLDVGPLPASGTYTFVLQQRGTGYNSRGNLDLTLSGPTTGTLHADDPTSVINAAVPGQGVSYDFSATAGEYLALSVVGDSSPLAGAAVTVFGPDGSTYATGRFSADVNDGNKAIVNLGPIPASGNYRALVQQTSGAGGADTWRLTLSRVARGALTFDTPANVSLPLPGQGLLYTFTANAGDSVAVKLASLSGLNLSNANLTVLTPDGVPIKLATLTSSTCTGCSGSLASGGEMHVVALPKTGTYSVLVQQTGALGSGAGTVRVEVDHLSISAGSTWTVNTTTPGQIDNHTFTAVAGQSMTLALSGLSFAPASTGALSIVVKRPDGSIAASNSCQLSGATCELSLRDLSQSGTYTVTAQPPSTVTMSFNATLSQAITGLLAFDTPQTFSTSTLGQAALLSFTAAKGQAITVYLNSIATAPASLPLSFAVFNSAGTSVTSGSGATEGALNFYSAATDTYFVWILPNSTPTTGSFQIVLVSGSNTSLPAGGGSANFSSAVFGENASLAFNATAGQSITVSLSSLTVTPSSAMDLAVSLIKPDGTGIFTSGCSSTGPACTFAARNLPQTGLYSLRVEPRERVKMNFLASWAPARTGNLAPDVPQSVSLATLGQPASLTFTVTAGQSFALNLKRTNASPAGTTVWGRVLNSAGTAVLSNNFVDELTWDLPNLAADTYTLWIVPVNAPSTSELQVALQSAAAAQLVADSGTRRFNTVFRGQSLFATFQGSAGQTLTLAMSDPHFTLGPAGNIQMVVKQPDGSGLTQVTCTPSGIGCELALRNLPVSGLYSVTISKADSAMDFNLTLANPVTGTLAPGERRTLNLSAIGQGALLTFTATGGQSITLTVNGVTTTPVNNALSVMVIPSSGVAILSQIASTAQTVSQRISDLAPDTYTLWIVPKDTPSTGTLQVSY